MLDNLDSKVLAGINEHARFVDISIRETVKCINCWIENDSRENLMETLERVTQAEKDANKIKKNLMNKISSNLGSVHRSDFLRLVLKMDLIPDYIEGAAVRISKVKMKCPKELGEKIKPLLEAILEMSSALKKTVKSISDNPGKTVELCDIIDESEEKIDSIYRDIEAYLFLSDIEVKQMLQIRNVLYHIEEAGDLCHENADHIRILISAF